MAGGPRRSEGGEGRAAPARWVVPAALALVAALLYAPLLAGGFAYDDELLLPALHGRGLGGLAFLTRGLWPEGIAAVNGLPVYRPLQELDFQVLLAAFGLAPWAFHAASLAALALVGALLFVLLGRLLADRGADPDQRAWGAGLLTGIVLLHPAHQEAVAFVAARNDLWAAAAVLSAALLWRGRRWWLAAPVLLAGMLFKETTAVGLLLLPALDWIRPGAAGIRARWARGAVLCLVPVAWLALRCGLARLPEEGLRWPPAWSAAAGLCHAGAVLVGARAPSLHQPLSLVLRTPAWWLPGAVALVALAAALGRTALGRVGLLLWVAAVGLALPFAVSTDNYGDRYLFVADLGLALGAVGLVAGLRWRPRTRALAVAGLLGLTAANALTLPRWASTEAAWGHAARHDPTGFSARMAGLECLRLGRSAEAERAFAAALAAPYPDRAAGLPLGEARLRRGDLAGGCAALAVAEVPGIEDQARLAGLIGLCARAHGDLHAASAALDRGLALKPDLPLLHLERYALARQAQDPARQAEALAALAGLGVSAAQAEAWVESTEALARGGSGP